MKKLYSFFFLLIVFLCLPLAAQDSTVVSSNDIATGGALTGVIAIGVSIWRFVQKYIPIIQDLADSNSQTRKELNDIKSQLINLKKGN